LPGYMLRVTTIKVCEKRGIRQVVETRRIIAHEIIDARKKVVAGDIAVMPLV
jgi:hypothetical protein